MFLGSPGIEAVLESARPIFDGPAFVLDASFQYVASSFSQKELASYESARRTTARGDLDMDAFLTYLREKDISRSMDIHGAFLLDMSEGSYLCVNLFDSSDEYIGCLYIDQTGKEPLEGEKTLAERLGKLVEKVCEENPALINHERDSLRDILRCLMEESPMLRSQRLRLKTVNGQRNYACVSVHYLKPFSSLPVRYICSIFEGSYPGGVFFGFRNTLLGLIPAELLSGRNGKGIGEKLSAILHDMQLRVGVSNEFSDLYMLRTYYLQAEAAMENGQLYGGKEDVYYFSEVALYEMVSNALGGLPVEVYFPKGFRELVNHDGSGGVSYLETLKVFLEENMSFSRASRRLYVHRSTLVERIERIGELLSADLEDPDQRLQLQMILKALEIERLAREKRQ